MTDLLYLGVTLAVAFVLLRWTFRMEPHWASKDGRRCICRGQLIDHHGRELGGWKEYRVEILDDGVVEIRPRSLLRGGSTRWRIVSRTPQQPHRKTVFVAKSAEGIDEMLLLRLPTGSRAVDALDSVAVGE